MKSIEEGALEYIHNTMGEFLHKDQSFKAGVEFAQRWIDCEDELPPLLTRVLAKVTDGVEDDIILFVYEGDLNELMYVTCWRPIELSQTCA